MSLTLYSRRDIREILFIVVVSAIIIISTTTSTKIRMLLVGQVARR